MYTFDTGNVELIVQPVTDENKLAHFVLTFVVDGVVWGSPFDTRDIFASGEYGSDRAGVEFDTLVHLGCLMVHPQMHRAAITTNDVRFTNKRERECEYSIEVYEVEELRPTLEFERMVYIYVRGSLAYAFPKHRALFDYDGILAIDGWREGAVTRNVKHPEADMYLWAIGKDAPIIDLLADMPLGDFTSTVVVERDAWGNYQAERRYHDAA